MRKVMLNAVDFAAKALTGKPYIELRFDGRSLALIADAVDDERQIRALPGGIAGPSQEVGLGIAVERDVTDISEGNLRLGEAVSDCLGGKSRPVLDAPEAFLFGGGNNLAVAHEASRRVAVVGVEAENEQG